MIPDSGFMIPATFVKNSDILNQGQTQVQNTDQIRISDAQIEE